MKIYVKNTTKVLHLLSTYLRKVKKQCSFTYMSHPKDNLGNDSVKHLQ